MTAAPDGGRSGDGPAGAAARPRFAALLVFAALAWTTTAPAANLEIVGGLATDFHLFSQREYHGYRNGALGLVVSPGRWRGFGVEFRAEHLWGTIGLGEDQFPPGWDGTGPRTVTLDHWLAGILPLWRGTLWRGLEFEGGAGMTWLDRVILEDGSRWNFLLMAGLRWRFGGSEGPVAVGLRFEHISNGGDIGFTDASVIGLESVALSVAWRVGGG